MTIPLFSPKAFLRSRRPERFSDTVSKEETELDRSMLEFHLSSLTSRGQENSFERFARRLCEREVCTNLLPQTGPTGGGDSKVDSETYPVADSLSLAWYSGFGRESALERWAFAFSAKADWAPKVKADIAKIVTANRGYAKAFFVTNQAVPDRRRAQVEDALRTKYGIDVRILDRTWILDRVFSGRHEEIAVQELGATALSRRHEMKGPLDVGRKGELEVLEARIVSAIQEGRLDSSLADDALDTANLARSLELPRADVEGRFRRADQVALKYGTPHQQVEAAYQWAWTLFYWFEDYSAFAAQYRVVEQRTKGSRNAYDLERLATLWFTLTAAERQNNQHLQSGQLDERADSLTHELYRLCGERDRPSTALQAETLLLQVQLLRQHSARESIDKTLSSLKDVIARSAGLIGYPLKPLLDSMAEIGKYFVGVAEFDDLFEVIVKAASARDSEVSAGRLLLGRGEQQLLQKQPVDAIVTLGRAFGLLFKHEARHDVVHALYLCAQAYEDVGLLWAARGTLLAAASVATNELWQYGEVTPYQAKCYRRLKWIELRLGRLACILAWHQLDIVVRNHLAKRGDDSEGSRPAELAFAVFLARLMLRTRHSDLEWLETLPDVLDRLGLDLASDALLYALGHTKRLEAAAREMGEDADDFAVKWRNLKSDVPLPRYPDICNRSTVSLETRVLGCKITLTSEADPRCIEVSESLLSAIESFLATSAFRRAWASEPELTIAVRSSTSLNEPLRISIEELAGRPHLDLCCRASDAHESVIGDRKAMQEMIFNAAVSSLSGTIVFRDPERDLDDLFRKEHVAERAGVFAASFGVQSDILGASPKTRLADWIDEGTNTFALCRSEPWRSEEEEEGVGDVQREDAASQSTLDDNTPAKMPNANEISHEEVRTVSIIRVRLWDRAQWAGAVYLTDPTRHNPPALGLVFHNREPALEIFTNWRREFGDVDRQELIRLAIVRGIDKNHLHAYRLVIGASPKASLMGTRLVTFVNRIQRMDATTPENLDRFLEAQKIEGMFYLFPAFASHGFDGTKRPDLDIDNGIAVRNLIVLNAWEIGINDFDSVAIQKGDDPVIPDKISSPPVAQLLQKLRGE